MTTESSGNTRYRWVVLGLISTLQCTLAVALTSFGPLAPFLIDTFGISRAQVGLFSALTYVPIAIFSIPAGWLVDRFGIRRWLLFGAGLFGLLFILLSRAESVNVAYVMVILMGLGYVFVAPTTVTALVHWFPSNIRATMVSIKQSAFSVGAAAGAVTIPALSLWLGWRNAVAIIGMAGCGVAVAGYLIYRESASRPPMVRVPPAATIRQVLANKRLLHLGLMAAAYMTLQTGISSYLVLELVEVRGMSVVVAGTFLMVVNIGGVVGRVLWGVVSDKVFGGARRPVLVIVGVTSGVTAVVLGVGGATMGAWLVYFAVLLCGLTTFGWNGVLMTLASEVSGKELAATGLGWVVTLLSVGVLVGPPLFGYIVDVTSSYQAAWLIFGILVIAAASSMALVRWGEASPAKGDAAPFGTPGA